MERNGFTFFRSYAEAAEKLPSKQRLALYDAIISYALYSAEPKVNGMAEAMFSLIKPTLDKSEALSRAGSRGGRPKKDKKQMESQGKARLSKNEKATPKPAPSEDMDKDIDRDMDIPPHTPPQASGETDVQRKRFSEFWAAYPRKVGKEAARKAWAKIKPTAELHTRILAAVDAAKRSDQWRRDGGQYIPHPTTWLNQGRWDDEHEAVQSQGSGNPFLDKLKRKGKA